MAAPTVRAVKETKKAAASELKVALPAGTEAEDFLVMYAVARKEAPPTISTPEGWTERGTIDVGAGAAKRNIYLFTRVCASSVETITLKASAEATDLYGIVVTITKGTYNTTTPLNVIGSFVEENVTEPKLPSVNTTVAECLALGYISAAAALTGKPEESWAVLQEVSFSGDIYSRTIAGAEATPTGKAKQAKNILAAITLAIAPVGEIVYVTGTTKVSLVGKAAFTPKLAIAGASQVKFADSNVLSQKNAVTGASRVGFASLSAPYQKNAVAGTAMVAFGDSATVLNSQNVTALTTIVLADGLTSTVAQRVIAYTKVVISAVATVVSGGARAKGLAGFSNPLSRLGGSKPSQRIGRSNPSQHRGE